MNVRAAEMKTVTLDDTEYSVREWHELSGSELNELADLLEKISAAEGRAFEKSITAFLKILLPDLTDAELSSDKKTRAMLFLKTYQQFLDSFSELSDRIDETMQRMKRKGFQKRLSNWKT